MSETKTLNGVQYRFQAPPPPETYQLTDVPVNLLSMSARLLNRTLCRVDLEASSPLRPDVVFNLIADPTQHEKIFGSILSSTAQLLEENGSKKRWQLDYKTKWNFWRVGGVCDTKLWLDTDSEKGTITFKLREPGFLRVYEGTWTIKNGNPEPTQQQVRQSSGFGSFPLAFVSPFSSATSSPAGSPPSSPRTLSLGNPSAMVSLASLEGELLSNVNELQDLGSLSSSLSSSEWSDDQEPLTLITIEKTMCPKICPPYPLNLTLKNQAQNQVKGMLKGLLGAAEAYCNGKRR